MINVELLQASHNKLNNKTLFTFKCIFPRFILAEVNTHRMLSKNTASSRAIPSKKFRKKILEYPVIPISIGQYQSGMQAGAELEGWKRFLAEKIWEYSRYPMVLSNFLLEKLGAHKQVQNRLIEPWMRCEQILSGTEWQNLTNLRAHSKAEPHFQILAYQLKNKIEQVQNRIKLLNTGVDNCQFDFDVFNNTYSTSDPSYIHAPLLSKEELNDLILSPDQKMFMSAARCARVSYFLPDSTKRSSLEEDMKLVNKLVGEDPKHMSPFEHQATFAVDLCRSGNFIGWHQFRKNIGIFPNEDGSRPI